MSDKINSTLDARDYLINELKKQFPYLRTISGNIAMPGFTAPKINEIS